MQAVLFSLWKVNDFLISKMNICDTLNTIEKKNSSIIFMELGLCCVTLCILTQQATKILERVFAKPAKCNIDPCSWLHFNSALWKCVNMNVCICTCIHTHKNTHTQTQAVFFNIKVKRNINYHKFTNFENPDINSLWKKWNCINVSIQLSVA